MRPPGRLPGQRDATTQARGADVCSDHGSAIDPFQNLRWKRKAEQHLNRNGEGKKTVYVWYYHMAASVLAAICNFLYG